MVIGWVRPIRKDLNLEKHSDSDLVKSKPKEKDLVTAMDFVKD